MSVRAKIDRSQGHEIIMSPNQPPTYNWIGEELIIGLMPEMSGITNSFRTQFRDGKISRITREHDLSAILNYVTEQDVKPSESCEYHTISRASEDAQL